MSARPLTPGLTAQLVAANVRRIRRDRRLSLRQLSLHLLAQGHRLSTSALGKIETGDRRVDVDDLVALAVALDVSTDDLLGIRCRPLPAGVWPP